MTRPRRPTPPPWETKLRRRGQIIIPDLRNVLVVLRSHPAFDACFAFDEMQQIPKLIDKPPICPDAAPGGQTPRMVDPEDITRLQEWLQLNYMPKLAREHVENALDEVCRERPVHPLRDWLTFLEWDGEERLEFFLGSALGCPFDDYHREIGEMFLTAMVARILDPGCQADYMIVLEGPQGIEKSNFCRALASDLYFSDALPRLDTDRVRVSMHLRGKWLIEISELSAFSKSEAGALKAFITQREEIYTPKYGKRERREPRQCLFIGTTNDDEYIRDDTGGRRYWPVKVETVNLEWLETNRDQLFAEAVVAYREGRPHWPDREFERSVIAPKQAEKQVFDHWTERVMEAARGLEKITIAGIWPFVSGTAHVERLGMVEQKRIAGILRTNGFKKGWDSKGSVVWRKAEK